jgi:CelD/BcsL family acetyltransferase involved in cellulose biosynthesis
VSWTHDYQLLGTPLVDRDRTRDTLAALLRAPWRTRRPAMLLELEGTGDDGPVAHALDEAVEELGGVAVRWETHERAALVRRPDGTVAPLSSSRLKRVRRSRRALERAAGPVTVVDSAGDPAAVERFLALEAAGWKGRAGTAMAVRPADAAFFREVCARFAAAGRLELRTLEVEAGPVAMQVALRAGDAVFHMKVAYDEAHGDHSPGVQLLVDYADRFPAEGLALRDSCTAAGNVTESQVWPGRRRVSDVVVPFAGPVGRIGVAALARLRARRSPSGESPPVLAPAG